MTQRCNEPRDCGRGRVIPKNPGTQSKFRTPGGCFKSKKLEINS